MKREDLRAMGIAEENIEKIMSDFGKEQAKANKNAGLQTELDTAKANAEELQKQLDAINEQNMSDIDKANKATEEANKRIQALEAEIAKNRQLQSLAEIGITGEQATSLFDEKGNLDYANLGKIISAREEAAKNATIQDIASKQGNPGGGSTGGNEPQKTQAEILASKMFAGNSDSNTNIISNYV